MRHLPPPLPRGTAPVPRELAHVRCPICHSTADMLMPDTSHASVPICFCPPCMYRRARERARRLLRETDLKE